MLPFLLFPTFLLFASHGDLLGVVCQHGKWNVRYWFNTKLVYFDTCYNNGMRHIECKRQNRFKTQDCRVIGVGSNAFWSDFSFPILTSNKKREAATIEAFILGLIRNLLLSKVSFYSTLVTLKKLSKVGVQTEWQRIKKSQRSRPEPKSAWYGRQPNLQSLSMHLRRHGILYDLISGTGPESDENQWLNTY